MFINCTQSLFQAENSERIPLFPSCERPKTLKAQLLKYFKYWSSIVDLELIIQDPVQDPTLESFGSGSGSGEQFFRIKYNV